MDVARVEDLTIVLPRAGTLLLALVLSLSKFQKAQPGSGSESEFTALSTELRTFKFPRHKLTPSTLFRSQQLCVFLP